MSHTGVLGAAEQPVDYEKLDATFKFSHKKDKAHISVESASYVKARCNDCYGRGFLRMVVGDGYKKSKAKLPAVPKSLHPNHKRQLVACHCVQAGYMKAVRSHMAAIAADAAPVVG